MKYLLFLTILIVFSVNTQSKLLSEASCAIRYVYYTPQDPTVAVYTTDTIVSEPAVSYTTVSPPVIQTGFPIQTYTANVQAAPMVLYYARKAAKEYRMSVVSNKDLENYDVKGDVISKDEKQKETWFSHDKNDKNDESFKKVMTQCKNLNTEVKSTKNYRKSDFVGKVIFSQPNELVKKEKKAEVKKVEEKTEKVNIPVVKEEKKAEPTKKVEAKTEVKKEEAKTEVKKEESKTEVKNKLRSFLEKKQDNDELMGMDDDDEVSKEMKKEKKTIVSDEAQAKAATKERKDDKGNTIIDKQHVANLNEELEANLENSDTDNNDDELAKDDDNDAAKTEDENDNFETEQEEKDQDELTENLEHDLNPTGENNEDLL